MLKEEQDIYWNLITIFCTELSARLCTGSATRPWAQGLIPYSWYSSMHNVSHLNLGCVFGIMGMLDAQPYCICFSWVKLPGAPLPSQIKGFLPPCSPPSSIHLCHGCAGEHLSPPPSPCPRILFPIEILPAIFLLFVRSQQPSSSSSRLTARP